MEMRSNRPMRFAPVVLLFATATAGAVVPKGAHVVADTLTALPAANVAKPLRTYVDVRFEARQSVAWRHFAASGVWDAAWDPVTGVPTRIWGEGIPAFGANASAQAAESYARQVLADNLALLAPGAAIGDFVLVSNQTDGAIRTVGFTQQLGTRAVVGGQISFEFKHDRLFVLGSQALPNVAIVEPTAKLARTAILSRATAALRTQLALPAATVSQLGDEVVLPLVGADAVLGYRVVSPITIDGGADGKYLAYVDRSGAPIAVHQQNHYSTGVLEFLGIDRYPMKGRVPRPAPLDIVTLGGMMQTADAAGTLTWSSSDPQPLMPTLSGTYVTIQNSGVTAMQATTSLTIAPAQTVVWDASAVPEDDAQLNAYVDLNIVKDFVRTYVDPQMPNLDGQITVITNIPMDCNAFFDGKAINLFHSTTTCQNTALVQDVIFHEFGHDVHETEIIMGVGAFDGAMSEGAADTLAVQITNDSGMGRGFFFTDEPLRELNPIGREWSWPQDIGEIHQTGEIYGGTMWDLRAALIAQYGMDVGTATLRKIYLGTLRRAVDIPTCLIEALAEDDDDGNLANGTPNECAIRDAFGAHGLRTANGSVDAPGFLDENALSTLVHINVTGLSTRCAGDTIANTELKWGPSYTGQPAAGETTAVATSNATYYAQLPLALNETVVYQADVNFADGATFKLPDNLADPYYQTYQGHTVNLYCTTMDTNPLTDGWTTGTGDATASPWSWGVPVSGATNPPAAFTGDHVLALALNNVYQPMAYSFAATPVIDVKNYSDVRLQYRRWLAVEDSHFDQARILANGTAAWMNATANMGDSSALQHIDREWRFHDVPLSGFFTGSQLTVTFDLRSDPGLELSGWAIDDLCIVANLNSICGDGVKTATEQCDNGSANADTADACRTTCRLAICGDSIVDSNEECDEGPMGGNACTMDCKAITPPNLGGCCETGRDARGSLLLGAAVLLAGRRRRRHR